jgi:predicted MFS family arabinose efflux permease
VPAGTVLGGPLGYRGAAVCLLSALSVRFLLPTVAASPAVGLRARLAVAADPAVLAVLGISVLSLVAVMSVYTYVAPLLAASAGVSGPVLSLLLVGYGLGALVGNDLGGRLTDRFGSLRPLTVILPVFALVIATLPITATTAVGAGIALFVLGAGWTVNSPIQTRLIEITPDNSALVLSLNASAIYLGAGLSGIVGGLVVDAFGVLALPPVAVLFQVAAIGLLIVVRRQEPTAAGPSAPR